jgi:hypothetical protein
MLAEVRAYDGVQDRRSAVAQAAIVKFAATDWRGYRHKLRMGRNRGRTICADALPVVESCKI